MILILIIIFIFYCITKKIEKFNVNQIYKNEFLKLIDSIYKNREKNIKYKINIISSVSKKYLNFDYDNFSFNNIKIVDLHLKKIEGNNKVYIFNNDNLYLHYNKDLNLISTKLKNLDDGNIFEIVNINKKFYELDYNKFRFIAYIKKGNKYLGFKGFTNIPEKLFFDIKINI